MQTQTIATGRAAIQTYDRYIDDREAADMLGLSRAYLRNLRVSGGGCRFSKFGRAVRYRVGDLLAWANDNSASSTSEVA